MNDSLFEIPEQLSPRLAWMQEHDIKTRAKVYDRFTGDERWMAYTSQENNGPHEFGDTEDEALDALAVKLNLKLWNQP